VKRINSDSHSEVGDRSLKLFQCKSLVQFTWTLVRNCKKSDFCTGVAGFSLLREIGIMRSIEQLVEEILSLPAKLRALLADRLVENPHISLDAKML
jgi:hypothetical protein